MSQPPRMRGNYCPSGAAQRRPEPINTTVEKGMRRRRASPLSSAVMGSGLALRAPRNDSGAHPLSPHAEEARSAVSKHEGVSRERRILLRDAPEGEAPQDQR